MNCYNEQHIFDFINKELADQELKLIEKHIQECSICNEIYNQKLEEINSLKSYVHEFDQSPVHIPEFIYPKQEKQKKPLNIKPSILRLSIAATILILISISILFLNHKKDSNLNLQMLQMQEIMLIPDMNEAWHNRDLIFTQTNTETGETVVFLNSETDN